MNQGCRLCLQTQGSIRFSIGKGWPSRKW